MEPMLRAPADCRLIGVNANAKRAPWNQAKPVGQKAPSDPKEIWAMRVRLQIAKRVRHLPRWHLGIDSKLRAGDLTASPVREVCHGDPIASRAVVLQCKTQRSVPFEITAPARQAVQAWIRPARLESSDDLFPSRRDRRHPIATSQHARVVRGWVKDLGLDPAGNGTHCLRRTKAPRIYQRTQHLLAVQRMRGHSKIDSTVRYAGIEVIEVDDALEMAEQNEVQEL